MSKYIDADLLRKEIERQRQFIEELFTEGDNSFYDGQDDAYCYILALLAFLDSIQEQPVEGLGDEAESYWIEAGWSKVMTLGRFKTIANYFYELGCRRTAVMYDDIEYNRQMAEEAELSGDLEEEVKRYWNEHALEYRIGRVADIDFLHLTARHFAEWGKNNLK